MLRVAIVDDHEIVRAGFREMLAAKNQSAPISDALDVNRDDYVTKEEAKHSADFD